MDGQTNKRIAFVTNRLDAYSETFIRVQIDRLQPEIILHEGLLPSKKNGEYIIGPFLRRINKICKRIFHIDFISLENRIASQLKKNKIDVVFVQYGPAGVAMLPVCKKKGIPLVVHFHGYDASKKAILQQHESAYRELFSYARQIIVVSNSMKEAIHALGCPLQKIVYNPYGPGDLFFKISPAYTSDILFAAGRFVEKKGPELTIRSFEKIIHEFPEARLYMAGDGPLLEHCKQTVKKLSLQKNVFFPGVLKPEMISGFMQKSLAFVQHSMVSSTGDSEGCPVVILEASASAIPIISTLHAGIPDIVQDGITGFLVPEKDIDKMAEAMKVILNDKELAAKMGQAGRERIKNNFSLDKYINGLRTVLNA